MSEKKTLCCPKCRSGNLGLVESILIAENREIRNGVISEVLWSEPITTKGYTANCDDCGHRWVPRDKTVEAAREASSEIVERTNP